MIRFSKLIGTLRFPGNFQFDFCPEFLIVDPKYGKQTNITQQIAQTESFDVEEGSQSDELEEIQQQQQPILGIPPQLANTTGMPLNNINPYAPPGIRTAILAKVKRNEYVDFDELLPPPPPINNDPDLLGFQLDPNNNLLLKPNQVKAKIRDYPSWICAWNIYQQAVLHFHPSKHFDLFSYFKILTNLERKHRFESVYLYDKSQRQTLAAQHTLPKISRTASWNIVNEEL